MCILKFNKTKNSIQKSIVYDLGISNPTKIGRKEFVVKLHSYCLVYHILLQKNWVSV